MFSFLNKLLFLLILIVPQSRGYSLALINLPSDCGLHSVGSLVKVYPDEGSLIDSAIGVSSSVDITNVINSNGIAKQFSDEILYNPRINNERLLSEFTYTEVPVYELPDDSLSIILYNGYAKAPVLNASEYMVDYDRYRVSSVDIVYTKYPYEKQDWLTNYYDLLSWRLKALFEYDSLLNDSSVVWGRILQTSCKTAWEARNLFHGIVITLEPREQLAMDEDAPDDSQPRRSLPEPIENGGFLFSGERNPDYFRSRLIFEPEPGQEPRRNMDPSKLRCPNWR